MKSVLSISTKETRRVADGRAKMAHRLIEWLVVGISVLVAVPAAGQSSSLMQRSREIATTRPIEASSTPPITQGYTGLVRRPTAAATRVLQQSSLIAVTPEPPKTFKVHDLLTIVVREQKKFESDAILDNRKDATFDAQLDAFFRIHDKKWQQQAFQGGTPKIKGKFGGKLKGDSSSEREDKLQTRITAEIVDVKPNGNLVLEATAFIKSDEEEISMTLTGTCRDLDVMPDNTVLSTQLAEKRIIMKHKGAVYDTASRGWIPRALDWLKPF